MLITLQNFIFLFQAGVAQLQLHQKTIHLRLRQRKGAFQLDRILGRYHDEGARQWVRFAVHRDLTLLHGLQ